MIRPSYICYTNLRKCIITSLLILALNGWMYLTEQYLVFLLAGVADTPFVTLPKGKGVKLSILEEREMILKKRKAAAAN